MLIKSKGNKDKKTWIHPSRRKVLDVMNGTYTKSTFGYEGEVKKKREIGERWTDGDGKEWEQREGFIVSVTKYDEAREFLDKISTCKGNDCDLIGRAKGANLRFIRQTGFCINCLVKREAKMREVGLYENYEYWKMNSVGLGKLKDEKARFEQALKDLDTLPQFVNEDGSIEKWEFNENTTKIRKDLEQDITDISEIINKFQTAVDEDWEIIKEKYNEIFNN